MATNNDHPLSILMDMASEYRASGLPVPPVTAEQARQLKQVAPFLFSTMKESDPLLNPGYLMSELIDSGVPSMTFGVAGHGINSFDFHYFLCSRPIAIFLVFALPVLGQEAGVPENQLMQKLNVCESLFLGAEYLFEIEKLREQVVVFETPNGRSGLGVVRQGEIVWQFESGDALVKAGQWLESEFQ